MRCAINLPTFGKFADPRVLGELARDAEEAGWAGCFVWDHIQVDKAEPLTDPWIALTAMALMTTRIRIGPIVTPLYRRYPWKVARETVSLDHLAKGRLILGVGLGSDMFGEISTFDGPTADKARAQALDESLQVLLGLWSGEPFAFDGTHFRVRETRFLPKPLQNPRIPVWVAGTWPGRPPFRRAARYDGVVAVAGNLEAALSPAQVSEMVAYTQRFRTAGSPFDIVQFGETDGTDKKEDNEVTAAYESVGVTWWLESIFPRYREPAAARVRILRGPPQLEAS
jgi:alkanesulfonate monooxygenase SsuD/methylene tetrahydromethanopterin reductase-like flavin-dependent oxidoreductase (luciferase family)